MLLNSYFDPAWLGKLLKRPGNILEEELYGHSYSARIAIPDYKSILADFYHDIVNGDLDTLCAGIEGACVFDHYGLIIEFDKPIELSLHDSEMAIDDGLRKIMAQVGPVIIRNAYMDSKSRDLGHRNRFPHLNFHVDRSANQETRYSMYARNPFDSEQKLPRTVSTLFIANIVGYLQGVRENLVDRQFDKSIRGTYTMSDDTDMDTLLGRIVLEQPWDAPKGRGEIAMQDNLTNLHASYYRDPVVKGYKIGVRYLK